MSASPCRSRSSPAAAAFPAIRSIARREEVGGIVVGLPRLLGGEEGAAAAAARALGERLRSRLDLPVEYEDERLTSVAAERSAQSRRASDDLAAALLLQQFIDRRRRLREDARMDDAGDP